MGNLLSNVNKKLEDVKVLKYVNMAVKAKDFLLPLLKYWSMFLITIVVIGIFSN